MFVAPSFDGQNDLTASSPIIIALRSLPPNHILTCRPTFGWLLHPSIQQKPSKSKPLCSLYFPFFRPSIRRPKRQVNVLPTRSSPATSPLQCSPCRRHHHFVDCYVEPTSGGNLRPVLRPSPNFLVGAIWVPQTRESATAHANSGADPCVRLTGSRGAALERAAESHGRQKRQWRTSPWLACFVFVVCCVCGILVAVQVAKIISTGVLILFCNPS